MSKFENELKEVLNGLANAIEEENEAKYGTLVTDIIKVLSNSPYDFTKPDTFNTMFLFPLSQIVEKIAQQLHRQQDVNVKDKFKPQFIFMYYQYLSSNIEKLIENKMGNSSCVADRSRYILKMYLDYSLTGIIPETDTEEHYWVPKFGTNEEWVAFCDGLYKLFYGNHELYSEAYDKLWTAEIRKFPHTRYTLIANFVDGKKIIVEETYDKPVVLPQLKNGYYHIRKNAFDENMEYEDVEKDEYYLGRFFYKVPKEDIVEFMAETKEVMV